MYSLLNSSHIDVDKNSDGNETALLEDWLVLKISI